ncbi:MAG: DnaJ domain-containing protein [Candidatus Taylorbacteria bacterium]|nr:DnaJ domain-containing protein [Candidatus Taylorbacteria bacterium]
MGKDYYKILGVDKSASKDDVKKAFRKLAHEYHPDKKGGNDAKFKEISEAYSVLGDDAKRKQFDTFGSAGPGFNPNNGAGGFNAQDFNGFDFSGFTQSGFGGQNGQGFEFDLGDIFGEFFGGRGGRNHEKRGNDISVDIEITFAESVFGVDKIITLTRPTVCDICKGTGGKPGTGMKTCDVCKGKGKVNEVRRSIFGNISTTHVCENCQGAGQIPEVICTECKGEGVRTKREDIKVHIPAGIDSGEMVKLNSFGEGISKGKSGDLYVRAHIKPHNIFKKDGMNLVMDLNIKLTTAITGDEISIETLDGPLIVKIPEGINHGEILRVKGKGVLNERHGLSSARRGDLMIKIFITIPKRVSKTASKLIEELKKEGI